MTKGFDVVNLHGTVSGVIATPYVGENGNWWIGNDDTGIRAQGDPGADADMSRVKALETEVKQLNSDMKGYDVLLALQKLTQGDAYHLAAAYSDYTFLDILFKPTYSNYGSKPVGMQSVRVRCSDLIPSESLTEDSAAHRIMYSVDNSNFATGQSVAAFLRITDRQMVLVDWLQTGSGYDGLYAEIRGIK